MVICFIIYYFHVFIFRFCMNCHNAKTSELETLTSKLNYIIGHQRQGLIAFTSIVLNSNSFKVI